MTQIRTRIRDPSTKTGSKSPTPVIAPLHMVRRFKSYSDFEVRMSNHILIHKHFDTKHFLFVTVASFAAFAMLTRSVANDVLTVGKELRTLADEFIPREYQDYYIHEMKKIIRNKDSEFTIVIDEYQAQSNTADEMYQAVATYLGTKVNESCIRKVNVCKNKEALTITMNEDEEIIDEFDGIQVKWRSTTKTEVANVQSGLKSYELTFHNRHRCKILESYLPFILKRSDEIKSEESGLKLHMIDADYNESKTVIIDNPMTFKTLAIEPEVKKMIMEDLNNFKDGKEYYRRIGKAWK